MLYGNGNRWTYMIVSISCQMITAGKYLQRALAWAAKAAKLRGAALLVVHAWQYPFKVLSSDYAPPIPDESCIKLWADDIINNAVGGNRTR